MKFAFKHGYLDNYINHAFFTFLHKQRKIFNRISMPHIRGLFYYATVFNMRKHDTKVISEF